MLRAPKANAQFAKASANDVLPRAASVPKRESNVDAVEVANDN